jgi:4-amino-4-deoxy-L-arabinose transferase-like glycosyltransferase
MIRSGSHSSADCLIMLLYGTIGSAYGRTAGLLAAGLVAFLPDVLAHGGVAYNDLPLALAFFAALWAVDSAARRPTVATGALAGALVGLAAAVKISGLALLPAAVVLIAVEATVRRADRRWLRRLVPALGVAAVAAYTTIVIVYAGDVTLSGLRYAVAFRAQHMANGHGAGAFLLGDTSATGWWYFFPVAFLFKTSVGLHMLTAVALAGLLATLRREPGRLLRTRLRAPLVGGIIFGAALLSSNLNIGFRYALPVVPLLCAVTAVGIVKTWPSLPRVARAVTIAAVIWLAAFPLTYYPHFLGFISEYGPGRERNHTVLVDSSLDWGQGLLELRDFMARFETGPVYLSYFGSGVPSRYGIEYVALPSFFPLPQPGEVETAPRFAVISATNLAGVYLPSDPFARFRDMEPIAVLGQSLLVFPLLAE